MDGKKLVKMANEIAAFFAADGLQAPPALSFLDAILDYQRAARATPLVVIALVATTLGAEPTDWTQPFSPHSTRKTVNAGLKPMHVRPPPHVPPPFRRELEEAFLPSVDGLISAVREVLRG